MSPGDGDLREPASVADPGAESAGARPLIGVTIGDPAGIGAEVIVKALSDPALRALGRFVLYGSTEVLDEAADSSGIRPFWFTVGPEEALRIDSGVVAVDVPRGPAGFWVTPRATAAGGQASLAYLEAAVVAARDNGRTGGARRLAAIVTGPISKTSWRLAGIRYPGHTELLADRFYAKRVTMAFVGGGMRIALASGHIGLLELRNHFTLGMVFQAIDLLHAALKDWFSVAAPCIAVCGLNPHAGEDGRFGDEEKRVIEPAMEMARNAGVHVEGPFPADTLFLPGRRDRFDGIVAMYHDQGLIPMKMLAFHSAVNVTLGLPIIRTSPDHGTAFDIAGMNRADPGSMRAAISLACQLAVKSAVAPSCQPPSARCDSANTLSGAR